MIAFDRKVHQAQPAEPCDHDAMNDPQLDATIAACRQLITTRFPADQDAGAAAMLLEDGTILTGTAPETLNASVELCHETEPYCAAYRLQQRIIASVCLHRQASGRTVVLSPCGICRERLAIHGPDVLVAVADPKDPVHVQWKKLSAVLPDYWLVAFPEDIDPRWLPTS